MQDKQHLDLLLSIAQDFYLNKLSVSDLSVKYDVSRYYISKYLEEIIDNHLVSIHINTPSTATLPWSGRLNVNLRLKMSTL